MRPCCTLGGMKSRIHNTSIVFDMSMWTRHLSVSMFLLLLPLDIYVDVSFFVVSCFGLLCCRFIAINLFLI